MFGEQRSNRQTCGIGLFTLPLITARKPYASICRKHDGNAKAYICFRLRKCKWQRFQLWRMFPSRFRHGNLLIQFPLRFSRGNQPSLKQNFLSSFFFAKNIYSSLHLSRTSLYLEPNPVLLGFDWQFFSVMYLLLFSCFVIHLSYLTFKC